MKKVAISKFFRFQYVDERNARLAAAEKEKGTPLSYEEKKQIVAQLPVPNGAATQSQVSCKFAECL